ncbi:hypothetical protein SASPL_124309 [Salvia splendens]|uniref:Uncharacterized protein n=1 Tax=Salvia splendens TaxID=180675 RepID=A0A8X8XRY6_SALSN|nr:hypothetical protein SASPL_124309 [Salvia splendens]
MCPVDWILDIMARDASSLMDFAYNSIDLGIISLGGFDSPPRLCSLLQLRPDDESREVHIDVGSSFRSVPNCPDPIHNADPPIPLNAPTDHFTKEVPNIDVGSSFRSDPNGYEHIHDGATPHVLQSSHAHYAPKPLS